MLVPVLSGSDKTTVSVASGHQEYHPVYASAGNITNTARRGHGNAVLPVAFLPIPKSMLFVAFMFLVLSYIYSKQTAAEEARIPEILSPAVPCMFRSSL